MGRGCAYHEEVETRCLPASSPGALLEAVRLLKNGEVVAFPTETVYGLGADAKNPQAVARIFEAKARPADDPLIIHVATAEAGAACLEAVGDLYWQLAQEFWPGPLTLVGKVKPGYLAEGVMGGLQTVAVRCPAHPVALDLLALFGGPIAAPSANPFGKLSPTQASHVMEGLGGRIPLVLDGGPCGFGLESTILSLEGVPKILRQGAVTQEALEKILGPLEAWTSSSRPQAPGQMDEHYSPRTPLVVVEEAGLRDLVPRAGSLLLSWFPLGEAGSGFKDRWVLSEAWDLEEAGRSLYRRLWEADGGEFATIYMVRGKEEGVGRAMNDRILRASKKLVDT